MQQQESSLTSIPINQLAMLRLNSAAVNYHSTTTTTTSSTVVTPDRTTVYGGTTTTTSKRSFCPFSSTLQEPFPKRAATLDHKTDQETPAKKMLPPPLYRTYSDPTGGSSSSSRNDIVITPSPSPAKKPPLPPPLYRTISDPTGGSARNEIITQLQHSPTATSMRLKRMKKGMREMSQWCNHMIHQEDAAVSQENNHFKEENEREAPSACDCEEAVDHVEGFMKLPLSQETPAKKMLPPSPPPLKRTYSDPTGGAASTSYTKNSPQKITPSPSPSRAKKPPLPPPLSRTLSDPTQLQESPTATNMRLKRMKEGMREMSQWCSHLIHQEEDAAASQENDNFKEENERETLSACDCEEAVWVERMGECLVLHFKCPCGKGYEILLLGNKCYYMLD